MTGMPVRLRQQIEALAEDAGALARDAKALSEAYRTRTGEGRRLAVTEGDALSYACARMPATFAAAQRALELTLPCMPCEIGTVTDCGAGTGALTLAAFSALQPSRMLCLERESAMRGLGERITALEGVPAEWRDFDLVRQVVPPAELVCEGYMLGELAAGDRPAAVLKLWAATEKMLLLVEPGTLQGWRNLQEARRLLTDEGTYTAAPCPGETACPLGEGDWCHFSVRVERTRLMKRLKGGEAPYEDEKFAFLALTREKPVPCRARILRHPDVQKGRIALAACTGQGRQTLAVTKKDPLWKRARKAEWGDAL